MLARLVLYLLAGCACVLAQRPTLVVNGGFEDHADAPPYFPGWSDTTWLPASRDDASEAVAGGSYSAAVLSSTR